MLHYKVILYFKSKSRSCIQEGKKMLKVKTTAFTQREGH